MQCSRIFQKAPQTYRDCKQHHVSLRPPTWTPSRKPSPSHHHQVRALPTDVCSLRAKDTNLTARLLGQTFNYRGKRETESAVSAEKRTALTVDKLYFKGQLFQDANIPQKTKQTKRKKERKERNYSPFKLQSKNATFSSGLVCRPSVRFLYRF